MERLWRAIERHQPERLPSISHLARAIAITREFDLDDLGAEVRKVLADARPGDDLPRLDAAEVGER
jgi:hypothetical protein